MKQFVVESPSDLFSDTLRILNHIGVIGIDEDELADILSRVKAGDVVSHYFNRASNGIFNWAGDSGLRASIGGGV